MAGTTATAPPPGVGSAASATRRLPAILGLLVLALLAMSFAGPWSPPLSEGPPPPPPIDLSDVPEIAPAPDIFEEILAEAGTEPIDLSGAAMVVGGVVAALLLGWALRVAARRRGWRVPGRAESVPGRMGDLAPGAEVSLPAMQAGADAALAALQVSRLEPRDAIIAAWVALEDAAEISGVTRDPADTPTEFTLAVLDATPAEPAAARTLLALYLRARFSTEVMTPTDTAAATAAAASIATDLTEARFGPAREEPSDEDGGEP